ncbi:MAG: hypothetical protein K2L39_05130 [Muribaculaceae bacterium]|nr:hypothetical protein [Muribaculaceae bacterium]
MEEYNDIERLLRPGRDIKASPELRRKVELAMDENLMARSARLASPRLRLRLRPAAWGAICAVMAVAAVLMIFVIPPRVTAREMLSWGDAAFREMPDFSMTVEVRTRPMENFAAISLDGELVTHRMVVSRRDSSVIWRIEKEGRVAAGDSTGTYSWIDGLNVGWHTQSPPERIVGYFSNLLFPEKIMERELLACSPESGVESRVRRDGDKLILTVRAPALGDFSNPYMLNATITESENIRRYEFDASTKRLESCSVSVVDNGHETEVLRLKDIVYGGMEDTLPGLPENVRFIELDSPDSPSGLAGLGPEEAASVFLDALRSWDTSVIGKAIDLSVADKLYRDEFSGAVLTGIGPSFRSGKGESVFVPYRLKMPDGSVRSHNLSVTQNSVGAWVVTGGL